ncbi:tetratricopeptide repeat protein [Glycomyces sp. L485]|uniref:tetratricopeptide repeat protein n=1 Tax=Glycomyces sp. L485 TaxID=2909235 RepID=UPI001F4AC205|nr:tetratricopeptide repeat protein [Glycomyces sp. L485]
MIEFSALAAPAAKSLAQQLTRGVVAGRGRQRLRVGKDSSDLQKALIAIVKDGVDDAAQELFDDPEEQESFRRGLIDQDRESWPLVNGTYPGDLVAVACEWVAPLLAEVDEGGRLPAVRTDHPWVEAVSAAIMGRLQHWALRGDTAVTPMWQAFLTETEAAEVFDASKIPPRLEELRGESLFDILQFKYRTVRFVTGGLHDREAAATITWARDGEGHPGIAVGLITGGAGTGKSRLAAEVCDRLVDLAPEWQAGFADYAALPEAGLPQRPMLLVCDYPERHPDRVGDFLARLWRHHREGRLTVPVRVLLVSRHRETWWAPVRARCRNLDQLIDCHIDLDPGQLDADELDRHAEQAFADFCDGFGIPNVWRQARNVRHAGADRPLLVHIAALLGANELAHRVPTAVDTAWEAPSGDEALLEDLIAVEVDRLGRLRVDGAADRSLVFGGAAAVRQALCVTTLTAPARCDLPDLLACAEAFGPNGTENRVQVADALLDAFPAAVAGQLGDRSLSSIVPVEPDLVAAHLLARTPGRSELVKSLITSETIARRPAYHAQLVGALALAAEDYGAVGSDLKEHLASSLAALTGAGEMTAAPLATLLEERLIALVKAAVAQAAEQDLAAARQLALALALPDHRDRTAIDEAAADAIATGLVRFPHPGLAGLGTALATRALAYHERHPHPPDLADAHSSLGLWMSDNGQRSEALLHAERAVTLYEDLADRARDAYLGGLALSVGNLANSLGDVGRWAEGLAASERSVALYRELIEIDRPEHLFGLATSVANLTNRLAAAGRWEQAVDAGQDAVAYCEALVESNRVAHLGHLAGAVNNLANCLARVGRWAEGLAASKWAVTLGEELVDSDRAAHLPDLATSVGGLANRLAEVGSRADALEAAKRATEFWKELVEDNRPAHLADLARSVHNLSNYLAVAGRLDEALAIAEQAVTMREELADSNRAAHLPNLASSVANLAVRLAGAKRQGDALAAGERAVALFEESVESNRAAYLADLAGSIGNLAVDLARAGRADEALDATKRAVKYYEELADANRVAYLPRLAGSLNNLSNRLVEAGRRDEALAAAERSVVLYEEVVECNRAAHLPDLARSLWTVARVLLELEIDPACALDFCNRAIELYRELTETEPEAFSDYLSAVTAFQQEAMGHDGDRELKRRA